VYKTVDITISYSRVHGQYSEQKPMTLHFASIVNLYISIHQ